MFLNHANLIMNQTPSEPKSAESRESGIVDTATFDISLVHLEASAQFEREASSISMQDSFSGDLESENAYHAKEDYENTQDSMSEEQSSMDGEYSDEEDWWNQDEDERSIPSSMPQHCCYMYREYVRNNAPPHSVCGSCMNSPQFCICWRFLMQEIREHRWLYPDPDPVIMYTNSLCLSELPCDLDCAKHIMSFVNFVPQVQMYVPYDMCLRAVLDQVRARDYVLHVPTNQSERLYRSIAEAQFDETKSDVYDQYAVWKQQFDIDYEEALKVGRKNYSPQVFKEVSESVADLLEKMERVKSIPIPPEFYYQIEGACILATGLLSATNVASAVCAIMSYARAATNESVAAQVKKLLMDNSWSCQADGVDWLDLLRAARTNWKMVVDNQHFSNLQNVLSIMVGLGMCNSSQVEFSIGGVKMFTQHAKAKQTSALDLVDAILTTVVAFVEGGIECFRTGSLKPMLYGDLEMNDLEKQAIRCERLYQYAKTGNLSDAEEGMTDNEFIQLQEQTIERLCEMKRAQKGGIAEKMLSSKLDKLRKEKTEFDRIRTKGGLRIAPWAGLIYGASGVGKSSVANIMMVCSLLQNGFPAGDEYICTNNEYDKYDSTLKSYVTGIFFDDMCNTKTDLVDGAPCSRLIEVINNIRAYGNMAEADLKGKVTKEPKVVITTTNVKGLCSVEQSNEPLSIERRNQYIMTVRVKDDFATNGMLDSTKVKQFYKNWTEERADGSVHSGIPIVPDLWLLTLEKAIGVKNPTPGRPDLVTYEAIEFQGKKLIDVSIFTALKWNHVASHEYFDNQKLLVANQSNMAGKICICNECGLPGMCCDCVATEKDEQFGGMIATFAVNSWYARKKKAMSFWEQFEEKIEARLLSQMQSRLEFLETHPYAQWTNWLPTEWLADEDVMNAILWMRSDELAAAVRTRYVCFGLLLVYSAACVLICSGMPRLFAICGVLFALYKIAQVVEIEKARLYARIREDNDSMSATFKEVRGSFVTYVTNGCIVLGAAYALACIYRHISITTYDPQGNLAPTTYTDILQRDKEAELIETISEEQNWDTAYVAPTPCSEVSKTATTEQLVSKVWVNEVQFEYREGDEFKPACGMVFLESNIALIPRHVWKKGREDLEIRISRGTKRIQVFHAMISVSHTVAIAGSDLCLVYIPNAGSWADLRAYLPLVRYEEKRSIPLRFIYKHMWKSVVPHQVQCDTVGTFGTVHTNVKQSYFGAEYVLGIETGPGLCMGTLITRTREAMIAGFHVAGTNGAHQGALNMITRAEYEQARSLLAQQSGVCIGASQGVLQQQMYGKPILMSTEIHSKSPVNDLPQNAHIDVYGTCTGRATYYSDVIETPIADTVCEECVVEKLFDKPKFHLGDAWRKSLLVSCHPSIGVEPSLLVPAVDDYAQHMIGCVKRIPELAEYVRPLTEMENVCGIDGLRFIDKINPHSSIGYPLSGAKEPYIERLDPEEFPGVSCPAQLDQRFWDEAKRMESEYAQERRCHVPFKACLKDEPTKKTKDKVRVFQASPIALQLMIRKYYLPVVRLLSLFPLDSECGVGINTMGPEFDTLVKHMRKFGSDRILAGDYSKYDLRMPAQLILAAFDVLIIIAQQFGYSEEDITIMRGIATDVAYPVMAYNGDLLQHFGSNPSGQNLTVYINSIVNSLLLRCAFYKIYEGKCVPSFRDVAAMMTYGDDVKGSVKKGFDAFNHVSYANFLKDRDMVFTMPDKESEPTPYMKDEDADFLKRKNVYNEELDQWMGALDETSVFKSLTSVLKSKAITPLEQSMQNIDGAMREWFAYGRNHYEMRRAQMKRVAAKHGITGGCAMLNRDYDECLEMYRHRYGLES